MNRHRHPRRQHQPGQLRDVVLMRMHAAGREQAQDVGGAAGLFQRGDETRQRRVGGQFAVRDRGADARQVLGHDAPGTQVHVPDFGVAHLVRR